MRWIVGIALALLSWGAEAQEVGAGLVCDTAQQVKTFIELIDTKDVQTSIGEINIKANAVACALSQIIYVRQEDIEQVRNTHGTYLIVRVTVIGAWNGQGFIPVHPTEQYILLSVKEGEA